MLQARALLAESAGDLAQALTLLRRAREASREDPEIAFDLARIALLAGEASMEGDFEGLLTLAPVSGEARLLRVYLLGRRGEDERARLEIDEAERTSADSQLTTAMRSWLSGSEEPSRLEARLTLGSQYDSNVTLAESDSPSGSAGFRLTADGEVTWRPIKDASFVSVSALLRYGAHVSGRTELAAYDAGSAMLAVRGAGRAGPVALDALVAASAVSIEGLSRQYLQEAYGEASATVELNGLKPGLFVLGGARDFVALNPEEELMDCDGPHVHGGALVGWSSRRMALLARLGYQAELAQGDEQRERGPAALLNGRVQLERVSLAAALSYEMRDYGAVGGRVDHRISPALAARLKLTDYFSIGVGYAWTRNASSAESGAFDYDRHLVDLGVEGGW